MRITDRIIEDIEAFKNRTGKTNTEIGVVAVNNGKAISAIRAQRATLRTVERIYIYMAKIEAPTSSDIEGEGEHVIP